MSANLVSLAFTVALPCLYPAERPLLAGPSTGQHSKTRTSAVDSQLLTHLLTCSHAAIVGRTPIQCLDRYEKLLDMAVSKEDKYDPADDPR